MQVTMINALAGGSAMDSDTPIADRFSHALAQRYVAAGEDLSSIQQASNSAEVASHPARLFQLQEALQEYSKEMAITAGLAHHAVGTVETLLKS
jgi:hypothetical protein